jgi:hypothetical protein
MSGATGSTGVPTERSTMPSGCDLAVAETSANVSHGKTGSDAESGPVSNLVVVTPVLSVGSASLSSPIPSVGFAQLSSPWGGMSLMACGSLSVCPTFDAPPGDPNSTKKSALYWV